MGPEDFLGIGPELECLLTGPELGPDRTDPLLCWEEEEGRDVLSEGGALDEGSTTGMSNILPSSPDFLMSPPV